MDNLYLKNRTERRRFPRKKASAGVGIRRIGTAQPACKSCAGIGHNISAGGICIELTTPLPVNEKVELEILLSEEMDILRTEGKVRWVNNFKREDIIVEGTRLRGRNNYKAGIEFLAPIPLLI